MKKKHSFRRNKPYFFSSRRKLILAQEKYVRTENQTFYVLHANIRLDRHLFVAIYIRLSTFDFWNASTETKIRLARMLF